jgi:hypothetical protein
MGNKILLYSSIILLVSASNLLSRQTEFSDYKSIYTRNVFRPLWKTYTQKKDDKSRQEELEALRLAEEERKLALQEAEKQRKIEAKQREIETNYTLTGIVLDNNKPQAVIQERNGTAHFVYKDDTINDIKITSIDENKGETVLDYQGKFTVKLRMQ